MAINRRRAAQIDKIDERKASLTSESRVDYGLSTLFRRYMIKWAGLNEVRWKHLAMLCLREICAWNEEMIGQTFGHPKGHVSRCLMSVKTELSAGFVSEFANHEVDSYVYIRVKDARALVGHLHDASAMLKNLRSQERNAEITDLIDEIEAQLSKWAETPV